MAKFQAGTTADLETVKARLADAETALAEAEVAAPSALLRQALGTATEDDAATIAKRSELRQQVDDLRLAVQAAQQAETDRQQQARRRDASAQLRACTQHLARLTKAIKAADALITNLHHQYTVAVDAGRGVVATLPRRLRGGGSAAEAAFSPSTLARVFREEIARHAGRGDGILEGHPLAGDRSGYVATMVERLIDRVATHVKGELATDLARLEKGEWPGLPLPGSPPAPGKSAAGSGVVPSTVEPAAAPHSPPVAAPKKPAPPVEDRPVSPPPRPLPPLPAVDLRGGAYLRAGTPDTETPAEGATP